MKAAINDGNVSHRAKVYLHSNIGLILFKISSHCQHPCQEWETSKVRFHSKWPSWETRMTCAWNISRKKRFRFCKIYIIYTLNMRCCVWCDEYIFPILSEIRPKCELERNIQIPSFVPPTCCLGGNQHSSHNYRSHTSFRQFKVGYHSRLEYPIGYYHVPVALLRPGYRVVSLLGIFSSIASLTHEFSHSADIVGEDNLPIALSNILANIRFGKDSS